MRPLFLFFFSLFFLLFLFFFFFSGAQFFARPQLLHDFLELVFKKLPRLGVYPFEASFNFFVFCASKNRKNERNVSKRDECHGRSRHRPKFSSL